MRLNACWQDRALRAWARLKHEAREELATGHRAAEPLDFEQEPRARAQFLALGAAFMAKWQPAGGIEQSLVDTLAQTYSSYLWWLGLLHIQSTLEARREEPSLRTHGQWQPARLDAAAAIEQSAAMVERFHRLFLRTLRALRGLRRYVPAVVVQHAGQVNVGHQHVNVAQAPANTKMST
jgi:hypothetical protein